MTPTFTVMIGSIGRSTLRHTLDSIARQTRVPGDQCIVSFDAFEQSEADLAARVKLVESYGSGFVATTYDSGYHHLGVEQINYAWRTLPITGSHIFTLGDDDVFVDGAYATLRPILAPEPLRPVLYRFLAPWRELLWDRPRLRVSKISGCCIAAPREFVREHPTQTTWPDGRPYVEHDYHWIEAIVAASGKAPHWLDKTLVIARPDGRGDDVAHRGVWQCWHCKHVRYYEDIDFLTVPKCPRCRATVDIPGAMNAVVA